MRLLALLAAPLLAAPTPSPKPAPPPAPALRVTIPTSSAAGLTVPARLDLGAITHFDQNWSPLLLGDARRAGLTTIRDEIRWGKVERSRGVYTFDSFAADYTQTVCRHGLRLLLEIDPRNALYDGGDTVRSAEGHAAFARFLNALLDRAGGCVRAIELGNEINGEAGRSIPAGTDFAKSYAALLEAVVPVVKQRHPEIAVIAGSAHSVATGFLARIAKAGGFAHVDGIAIHPYRPMPEGLDTEIAHLHAVLRDAGADRPIWVTEFGDQTDTPEVLAPYMLKSVALLSASGVAHAYWYALEDEQWFRNMGLFGSGTRIKPAGETARMLTGGLLDAGPARPIATGDALTQAYRFGTGANGGLVLWGSPRPVRFTGTPLFRDARGARIATPTALSDTPFVVSGAFDVTYGADPVIVDTRYDTAGTNWSNHVQMADGRVDPLPIIDWEWTSFHSLPWLNPMAMHPGSAVLRGGPDAPAAMLRYTAPRAHDVLLSACFTANSTAGIDVTIRHGTQTVYRERLDKRLLVQGQAITLTAGDTIDILLATRSAGPADYAAWRIRLIEPGSGLDPVCD